MLEQLFELIPDAMIVVDREGRIVRANSHAERLFGYPAGDLEGLSIEALMPVEMRDRHSRHRAEYMAHPRVRPMGDASLSLIGQRLDGGQFPVEISLGPIRTPDDMQYLALVRDVSESQRVRQALVRARYDALAARIGQVAMASGNDSDVIDMLPEQLVQALQAEAAAVILVTPDRAHARVVATHGIESRQLERFVRRPQRDTAVWRALANDQPVIVESLGHDEPDGWPQPMSGQASSVAVMPMSDRERPIGALIVMAQDTRRFSHDAMHLLRMTASLLTTSIQRRHTEEQLAHAQRLDAIGQLTGGVAHDFNNLLTVISGNLQLLEAREDLPPGAKGLIASASRATSRGADLTAKLLAFARRQRLSPQALEPEVLLAEMASMLRRTLGETIRIAVECQQPIANVFADSTLLDSALVNLALNARDAMPRGGEVTLSARECRIGSAGHDAEPGPGHYVMFSVGDTGCGMDPATLAHAVEPFFTTKKSGNGLGLSMVYGFIKQSGGYMHIDSRPSHGTRVEIYLPVATGSSRSAETSSASAPLEADGGKTVLVVEDEDEVRTIAEAFLHSLGYRVVSAGNAAEALQRLRETPSISLLFSDVRLGEGMDGYELARAACAMRPGLAVLMTSGYDENSVSPGEQHGFELMRKPYRRDELAAALKRCAGSRA
ncbi:PAS domain S-box protein [Marilutibacter chinensis]|uniref:histidine kinase n=1 Tax=Marilutibacter chinensis TaxID=2912247 RepID=A0ABS9HMW5_9GAMM|nr:PAS domain S-box protein [Lysobacter chinensis]MCF7220359.1 PAS domain S-box protein [Lysobacter chinensis]